MDDSLATFPQGWESLGELHASRSPPPSFEFISLSGPPVRVTGPELDRRCRALAAVLQDRLGPGDRVLLFLPAGPEFLIGLYACLYAGAIAVPTYPPDPTRLTRTLPRTLTMMRSAAARAVLVDSRAEGDALRLLRQDPRFDDVLVVDVSAESSGNAGKFRPLPCSLEAPALLQYTSGSQGQPKGVLLSTGNVLHNLAGITALTRMSAADRMFCWVPPSHDLGMITGYLLPVFVGMDSVLMQPEAFARRPLSGLESMSRARATVSAAPNFAFDLCARKCSAEEAASLDLSSVRLVVNGGEPVRAATIDRFCEKFAPAGFRRSAFWPSYGLAEACATVSGGFPDADPVVRGFDATELRNGRVVEADARESQRRLVGCGRSLPGQRIRIVDPVSLESLSDRSIGEIWVRGPSVATGYWEDAEATATSFGARLDEEGPFLRTGDLGFQDGEELFVTGRIKDLIIVRGRNHYPQDVEATVEALDGAAIRPGCTAAFPLELDDEERLGLCAEVSLSPHDPSFAETSARLCSRLYEEILTVHGVEPALLALLPPRRLPKTSSGKVQRRETREGIERGTLDCLYVFRPPAPAPEARNPSRTDILGFLLEEVARHSRVPREAIDPDRPLASFGFDSLRTLQLVESLETRLGRSIARTVPWDKPSISSIAEHLSGSAPVAEPEPGSEERRTRPAASRDSRREDVAVVGMACRFPGADNPQAFWRLLREGSDAIRELPAERWNLSVLHDPTPLRRGRMSTKLAGTLDRVDGFDAALFHISPREAPHLDPQQRLFLELGWEALEDAGQAPDSLRETETGVFAGVYQNDYFELQAGDPNQIDEYYGTGILLSVVANRLSYFLGLQGPSLVVDTACSSSLTAVHLACQALREGDCSLALAGGVSLMLSPGPMIYFSQLRTLAPDGRCKAFSRDADGFVRSEGGAVVVLKPLPRALADSDHIYAVVRGSAVNHGGRSNGLMAPNPDAQRRVIRKALERAEIEGAAVSYLEAHGTGTALGDPIELESIRAELLTARGPDRPLYLGSVKGNLGHLEAAAGIAGLMKVALMLDRGEMVPHVYGAPPIAELEGLPCVLPDRAGSWSAPSSRVAGVSSFGLGGANAHVILEEPARPAPSSVRSKLLPFFLAARTEPALRAYAARMAQCIEARPDEALEIANTVVSGRAHLRHRLALVASDARELADRLRKFAGSTGAAPGFYAAPDAQRVERASRPVFVVPGTASPESIRFMTTHPSATETLRTLGESPDGASDGNVAFLLAMCLHRAWLDVGLVPEYLLAIGSGAVTARCLLGELTPAEARHRLDSLDLRSSARFAFRWPPGDGSPPVTEAEEISWQRKLDHRVAVVLGETNAVQDALAAAVSARVVGLDGASEFSLLQAACDLYLEGVRADWRRILFAPATQKTGRTPTYPFERERYWTQSSRALSNYLDFIP